MAFAQGDYAETTAFINSPYVILRYYGDTGATAVYGNYPTFERASPPLTRLPPKNWRWYDVFRLWLARIPSGFLPSCAMPAHARIRVVTAPSMTQMRRQKRKLGVQRWRAGNT